MGWLTFACERYAAQEGQYDQNGTGDRKLHGWIPFAGWQVPSLRLGPGAAGRAYAPPKFPGFGQARPEPVLDVNVGKNTPDRSAIQALFSSVLARLIHARTGLRAPCGSARISAMRSNWLALNLLDLR